ncbi:hypothetical protein JN27_10575 [Massilia sp. BSC265]|nr:hypothetical protein JN27_10575 [Massilia sp. BSC265]
MLGPLLGTLMAVGAAGTVHADGTALQPVMKVHDLAGPFAEVWDRNVGRSDEEFIRDFKATVAAKFPAFYGVERFAGKKSEAQRDAEIAAARAAFPALRDAYTQKVNSFNRDLPTHIASFRKLFPDYEAKNDLWFVHSLGEMDGGKRRLNDELVFIFGADMMAKNQGKDAGAFFFHHELFHDYQPMQCSSWPVWTSLWQEGLASYAAQQLNPNATDDEMLLNLPPNMAVDTRKQLGRALDDLYTKLDSTDQEAYSGLFLRKGDKSGMPARRGYYLGMLVAEEAAKSMSLQQLAKLPCDAVRPVVVAAVERLRKAHAAAK